MPINFIDTWSELEEDCSMDVADAIRQCEDFEMYANVNVRNKMSAKRNLIHARGVFKLAVNSVLSLFYNQDVIIKNENDRIRLEILKQDLHSMLDGLEKQEDSLIVEEDHKDPILDRVNFSKLRKYQTSLLVAMDGLIYNSIKRAKREYYNLKEEDKTEENLIYLLFCITCNSASIFKETPKFTGSFGKKKMFFPPFMPVAIPRKREEEKQEKKPKEDIPLKEDTIPQKENEKKPEKEKEQELSEEEDDEEEDDEIIKGDMEESEAEDMGEYEDD